MNQNIRELGAVMASNPTEAISKYEMGQDMVDVPDVWYDPANQAGVVVIGQYSVYGPY